ncbi:hypothetical protein GIB67_025679 [Kingdonia uniflora]|uniref:BZIP domain-containing protein n=1 Tax=Kingdonia uniflora TaxID=39325 RepID=A0A7J7L8S9_9MAGN|nr:hypothetical protein GIB67_025679 [Kingdonia uniflora]
MGNEETDTPIKSPKSSSTQEQPPPSSPATIYPDWASYQAYYNSVGAPPIAPPAYFHPSATSSPQAHAYMWGQHLVPPYGTPPPYVTMYPPGGLYAHPSMPPGSHPYNPYVMLTPHGISEASSDFPTGMVLIWFAMARKKTNATMADNLAKLSTMFDELIEALGSRGFLTPPQKALFGPTTNLPPIIGKSDVNFAKNGTSVTTATTGFAQRGKPVSEKVTIRDKGGTRPLSQSQCSSPIETLARKMVGEIATDFREEEEPIATSGITRPLTRVRWAPKTGVAATGGKKIEGKSGESKSKIPLKRSKGSLGSLSMLTGDDNEEKTSGACNGGFSQGGESGGRGSSEGSDGNSQNDSQHSEKGSEDAEAQNGGTACSVSSGVTEAPPVQTAMSESMILALPPNCVSGPATNLNIGVDYWGGHLPSTVAASRAKLPTIPARPSPVPCSVMGPHDGTPSELWMQDERELKRQKRKQSNRESARRSRMRKQAEYDELAQRVDVLKDENTILREELERLREDCKNLASENTSLTEKLQKNLGQDSSMDGDNGQPESDPQVSTNVDLIGSDC